MEDLIVKERKGNFTDMWRSVEETGGGDPECRVDHGQLQDDGCECGQWGDSCGCFGFALGWGCGGGVRREVGAEWVNVFGLGGLC